MIQLLFASAVGLAGLAAIFIGSRAAARTQRSGLLMAALTLAGALLGIVAAFVTYWPDPSMQLTGYPVTSSVRMLEDGQWVELRSPGQPFVMLADFVAAFGLPWIVTAVVQRWRAGRKRRRG